MQSSVHQTESLLFFTLLQLAIMAIASTVVTTPALRVWLRRESREAAGAAD